MAEILQENTNLEGEEKNKTKIKPQHFRMDTHQSKYNKQLPVYKSALKQ